jgi:hypothetical protein
MRVNGVHRRRKTAAALVATALCGVAVPAHVAGGGIVALAAGSGQTTVAGELRTFSFVARIGPDGVATGTAEVDNRSVDEMFQLRIDCLKVVGRLAIVSGVFVRHTDEHAVGLTGIFAALDSGDGATLPDRITQVFFFEPGVLTCSNLGSDDAAPFLVDVEAGSLLVR